MSPSKCNYIVFSNSSKNTSHKLNLRLCNERLKYSDNPTFLGIQFDYRLTFKNQIDFIKQNCLNKLNCLKILSHKSKNLTSNTLKQIYYTLIRSVLEYSSILLPRLSKFSLNNLQVIQNTAIEIIYHLLFREHTKKYMKYQG